MAHKTPAREQGFALLTALWATILLALVVSSVSTTSTNETLMARSRQNTAELSAIADALVNITLLRLLDTGFSAKPPTDGTPFIISFAGHDASVALQDEDGKIDLNQAPGDLLLRLFLSEGLDLAMAQGLADKILDWREPGIGRRANGAKAAEYALAGLAYGPRNGPFETVEELKLVLGMTRELFDGIAPSLTVYAQNPWPNADVAPAQVLRALPGMDAARVAGILAARAQNGLTETAAPPGNVWFFAVWGG